MTINPKDRIEDIDARLKELPKGTLTYKTINGKKQPYVQKSVDGKVTSTYVKLDEREQVLLEFAELDGEQAHRDGQDKQERDELPASVIKLVRHQADHHTDDEAAHHRAPDERDGVQKAHNAAAEGAEHAPAPLDDLPAQA